MKTTKTNAQLVGEKIKELRTSLEVSQEKLAKAVGFTSSVAISLIENGDRKASVETLEKIAEFLGRDITFFLGEKPKSVSIAHALRANDYTDQQVNAILEYAEFTRRNGDKK